MIVTKRQHTLPHTHVDGESLPEMDHKLSTFIQLQSIKKFIYIFVKRNEWEETRWERTPNEGDKMK